MIYVTHDQDEAMALADRIGDARRHHPPDWHLTKQSSADDLVLALLASRR
jgi:ABC-type sugar transport system ATPase subunit